MTSDPYASHLPVLDTLCRRLRPEVVIEFGAGLWSTPLFLRHEAVKVLVSYEQLDGWRAGMEYALKDWREPEPSEWLLLKPLEGETFDFKDVHLIFIDDGANREERVRTIRAVAAARPTCPVVIHDWEQAEYQAAAGEAWANVYVYRPGDGLPETAVLWNSNAPGLLEAIAELKGQS